MGAVLEEREADGGESDGFPFGDGLEVEAVAFVPLAPLCCPDGGVLGAAEAGRAPVDGVLGEQVDDVRGGRLQGAGELGYGEVAAGHGLVEPFGADAVRVGPGQLEAVQRTVGELRRPLEGLVDAVLVEETSCGVSEEFRFGGQEPPAEALVVLALSGGGRRYAGVGKVSG